MRLSFRNPPQINTRTSSVKDEGKASNQSSSEALQDSQFKVSGLEPSRTGSPHPLQFNPDLSSEVANLSTKLIDSMNQQTQLDDALQATRHELAAARERVIALESAAKEHENLLRQGLLVRRTETVQIEESLRNEIVEERKKRSTAEKDKRSLELELESLTSSLFEEANNMVADARKAHADSEKRTEQLKGRLADSEALLANHQQQLRELKNVLHHIQSERVQDEPKPYTTPLTPTALTHDKNARVPDDANLSLDEPQAFVPQHPLHFSSLIQPILRTDLQSYDDFNVLLNSSKTAPMNGRVQSGNFAGLNVRGLGSLTNPIQSTVMNAMQAASRERDLSASAAISPSTPTSNNTTMTPGSPNDVASTLKESRFYKRVLSEDIEPTLRLDMAPGLSWLARRTVLNSMAQGSLTIEPMTAHAAPRYITPPCALCGEVRRDANFVRRHIFRTGDSDDAQRYPLCDYCVARVRATGDFVGFLRAARAGFWRGNSLEESGGAWEECVRLRERMFWTRLGGGVIPFGAAVQEPLRPRLSEDARGAGSGEDPFRATAGAAPELPQRPPGVSGVGTDLVGKHIPGAFD